MNFHSNMYGIIYKTTCLANGKIYVGQTTSSDPSYLGSGTKLRCAFKRYGRKKISKSNIGRTNSLRNRLAVSKAIKGTKWEDDRRKKLSSTASKRKSIPKGWNKGMKR